MGKKQRRKRLEQLAKLNQQQKETNMQTNSNQGTTVVNTSDVRQLKSIGAVMSCVLTHKVVATNHKLTWAGGKLNPIWPQVLAFFKWTYDTTHSESQLRLFVNKNTGEWMAWAFPQKAKLGMAAKEITDATGGDPEHYEKSKAQRAAIAPEWEYWGTVHHHCSAGAFQSGTDQNNETIQEGIHITVGFMDKSHYDIDVRIYVGGIRLDGFDLTDFWDITPVTQTFDPRMVNLMKDGWKQAVAKHLMGVPPPPTQEFPAVWKENIIDCTPKAVATTNREHGVYQPQFTPHWEHVNWRSILQRSKGDYDIDRKKASSEIKQLMKHPQCEFQDYKELLTTLEHLQNMINDGEMELLDICFRNDLTPAKLGEYLIKMLIEQEKTDEMLARDAAARADATTKVTAGTHVVIDGKVVKVGNGKKGKIIDAETIENDREKALKEYMESNHGASFYGDY